MKLSLEFTIDEVRSLLALVPEPAVSPLETVERFKELAAERPIDEVGPALLALRDFLSSISGPDPVVLEGPTDPAETPTEPIEKGD